VIAFDSPGEIDFALRAERISAGVFDAARFEELFLARLRRRHPGRRWVAWTAGYASGRTADLLARGADEVLNGTMGDAELRGRLLRVLEHRPESAGVVAGGLHIDGEAGTASWRGEQLALTAREREVLEALARAAGKPVRREALYREVWGFAMARGDRTVDVNVKRLRAKLGAVAPGLTIRTHTGVGYRLEIEEPAVLATMPVVTEL
jgi:DNA-binding response OmpR family regulator